MAYLVTRKSGLAGVKMGRPRPIRRPGVFPPISLPTARGRGSLGDVICLEGDCKIGQALVEEMQAVFKQLSGVGKDELDDSDVEFMRRFGPTVTQIIESFQAENAKLARQVPFSLVCCTIKELGRKAQDMSTQMRAFRNVSTPSPTPVTPPFTGPGGALGGALDTLLIIAGVGVAAVIVLPMLFHPRS